MYRFLIAEDDRPTLGQLQSLLREEFGEVLVDSAETVAQGSAHLKSVTGPGDCYDAALLDFKLPRFEGENPEVDSSLCNEIRGLHCGTVVIHMTSFLDDPGVLKHLQDSHNEPSAPAPFFVSKLDPTWGVELVKRLKTYLFGKEISDQMDAIFGSEQHLAGFARASALRRPVSSPGGVTHRLAALTQSIEEYWPDLSDSLRERIRGTFVVDILENEVRVSLL